MTRRILLQSVVLLLILGSTVVLSVRADGGKAKNVIYSTKEQPETGKGSWEFSINTSPIIFYVGTVNNKYHVLLIRIKNDTATPLNLAKDQDMIELRFSGGQKVKGLLNLSAVDGATWDGLETEIRTAVAYPEAVPPGEEEGIYFFVPVGDVANQRKKHEMPNSIIYNIKSVKRPVELFSRGPAAAAM